jgi:outer membrane protein TolC
MAVQIVLALRTFRTLRPALAASLLFSAIPTAELTAQPQPPAPASAPVYRLQDCLGIAQQKQPAIIAAQASLSAAYDAQRGLNEIPIGGRIISRDLPVRRQQAAHGIAAQAANLRQVEIDTNAAVSRLYYGVIYAREQAKVADDIVLRLKAIVANGETLLDKEGKPADLTPFSVGQAKSVLVIAQTRQEDAKHGLGLATAALREAMGLDSCVPFQVAEDKLPEPLEGVQKDTVVCLAVTRRGEVSMANSAVCISNLEIEAQSKTRWVKLPTAAAGGDMHARPIPTGSFGDDYKPGAIGIDFPTLFAGPRATRVDRATDLAARSGAVADKARNLVSLEAESAVLRWEQTLAKIKALKQGYTDADVLANKAQSALETGVIQSYRSVLELRVLTSQIHAQLNEAHYQHTVARTELERVTGGGFPAGITVMPPAR